MTCFWTNGVSVTCLEEEIIVPSTIGTVWVQRSNVGSRQWSSIASSSDGNILLATAYGEYPWVSLDSGVTWNQKTATHENAYSCAISSDGTKMIVGVLGMSRVFVSTDSGATWTNRSPDAYETQWRGVAISDDGLKMVAYNNGDNSPGYVYTSINGGISWTIRPAAGFIRHKKIAASSDGSIIYIAESGTDANIFYGKLWKSVDSGVTWTQHDPDTVHPNYQCNQVICSPDGSIVVVSCMFGLFKSEDYGVTWANISMPNSNAHQNICMSNDGFIIIGIDYNAGCYISEDGGLSYTNKGQSSIFWNGITCSDLGQKIAAIEIFGSIYTSIE